MHRSVCIGLGLNGMSKVVGLVRLVRPVNCLMMGIAVLVGALLTRNSQTSSNLIGLSLGFLTGFTLTAASMAINDYYDRIIDAINEPRRPIPSGLVKPKDALVFSFALTAMGLIAAFFTNVLCFFIAVIAWIMFATYTTVGKRSGLPGNFLVSACVATPFIYGNVVHLGNVSLNVLLFASMAFLSNTGREVTKGIVDVQGDRSRNVKTLAVMFGGRYASDIAAFFYLFAAMLSPVPVILGLVSFWFVPVVAVTDFGLIFSSILLLRNYSRENARRIKQMMLIWFLFGLLAFVVGTLG
jgi:geranylgeranylglycerol-phosphate geranylgeranyltransferase